MSGADSDMVRDTVTTTGSPGSQDSGCFVWNSCGGYDDQRRIKVKEEALTDGLKHCEQLIKTLENSFLDNSRLYEKGVGREILEKWVRYCKDLIKRHKEFRVLVGVAGPTGSGKTSALNALLGFSELLPTNNQEAATAVPCKVVYNNDDRPAFKFRASVTFRSKTNLTKQLDRFFEDLQSRDELQEADTGSSEDFEALRNANATLKPTFEMIRTVFGLEQHEVSKMTTGDLLKSKEDVGKLLGTIKKCYSGNLDKLSEQMKPYMDSTTAQHTGSGSEFAAWPLIDEVEILVKSDALRNGVVLVDLPGLADSVESRAAVAEAYFPKLVATLIVSPARRAADDSTAVKLMSDHQELRMKMDGKFHKRSYCVVVSQIDQIDRRSALRSREAKSNQELQQLLEKEKSVLSKKHEKAAEQKAALEQLREYEIALRAATSTTKKSKKASSGASKANQKAARYSRQVKSQKISIANITADLRALNAELKDIDGHITFICVQHRNKFLEDRIQNDFQRRQALITNNKHGDLKNTYDGKVSICPISAKAFWQCATGEECLAGFPEVAYSGIPNLTTWIRNATIPERESHSDSVLHDLHHCFNVIKTWSRKEWSHNRLQVDREWVEEKVFPSIYSVVKENLDNHWVQLNKSVEKHNPLHDRKQSLENCAQNCNKVVQGWSYKDPTNDASADRIHWMTYQANIRRKGGKFVSTAGNKRIEYSWMEDISDVLLRTIVADWNQALNHDIPGLAQPACKQIDRIWGDFLKRLRLSVTDTLPELLPFLEDVMPNLDVIKEQVKDKMRQALKDISKDASTVHPDMVNAIQQRWSTTFNKGIKIKGKGSLKQREESITTYAKTSSGKMYNAAFERMQKQLRENIRRLPGFLKEISTFAVQAVKDHIKVLLNNVILPNVKVEEDLKDKVKLQQYVRAVILEWDLKWKVSETTSSLLRTNDEDIAIPSIYHYMEDDLDDMDLDDEEFEDESVGGGADKDT
ncbi:hypothetical protein F4677DRAFT_462536 [Hypoxylon crocopeplum]|nr:hypothetical protein F4677DRAFT_462536 [Hypoxylon crocopeplum]